VYVVLLVVASGKLVECVRLIGEQGVLYGGSVADRPFLDVGADLRWFGLERCTVTPDRAL
jgi:hypothetical protein